MHRQRLDSALSDAEVELDSANARREASAREAAVLAARLKQAERRVEEEGMAAGSARDTAESLRRRLQSVEEEDTASHRGAQQRADVRAAQDAAEDAKKLVRALEVDLAQVRVAACHTCFRHGVACAGMCWCDAVACMWLVGGVPEQGADQGSSA